MKTPFVLGVVGHFGLAVRDPKKSARWFQRALGLRKEFDFNNGVAVGNDNVTIALFKGEPSPETIDHMSFHLPNMATLRKALAHLKSVDAAIEDPGDEIGPEAPGSKNMGLWIPELPARFRRRDLQWRHRRSSNARAPFAMSPCSAGETTCDRSFLATVHL